MYVKGLNWIWVFCFFLCHSLHCKHIILFGFYQSLFSFFNLHALLDPPFVLWSFYLRQSHCLINQGASTMAWEQFPLDHTIDEWLIMFLWVFPLLTKSLPLQWTSVLYQLLLIRVLKVNVTFGLVPPLSQMFCLSNRGDWICTVITLRHVYIYI